MGKFLTGPGLATRLRQALRSQIAVDVLIASVVVAATFVATLAADIHVVFHRLHRTFPVDELLMALMCGTLVLALRRIQSLDSDVRRRTAAEQEITRLALHDSLTGLPNRRLFEDRLNSALASARRDGEMIAVFMIDLDRFKPVNDLHGHEVGDQLLIAVAERINGIVREQDSFARFGGDEFALLQQSVTQPLGALRLARRLVRAIDEPFEIAGSHIVVGLSAGIAMCPTDANSASELLRRADVALFRAKTNGRGGFCFFEEHMDDNLHERAVLERDLAVAIAEDRLQALYQPIVDLASRTVIGYEALARWHHAERGAISPGTFVAVAEDSGQISALGEAILRRACRDALLWPKEILLSVNVSPLQFRDPRLADAILEVLAQEGFPPYRLEVEVTENALIDNPDLAARTIARLKAAKVQVSLDDFGTGYSSLAHLRDLPFDKVKIDRSFIGRLQQNAEGARLVKAIIVMCQSLGLPTVAEGVEDEAHCSALVDEGCVLGQGYLFGRPMPNDRLIEHFAKTRRALSAAVGE